MAAPICPILHRGLGARTPTTSPTARLLIIPLNPFALLFFSRLASRHCAHCLQCRAGTHSAWSRRYTTGCQSMQAIVDSRLRRTLQGLYHSSVSIIAFFVITFHLSHSHLSHAHSFFL